MTDTNNDTLHTLQVIQKLTQQIDQAVAERDAAEEAVSQAYYLVTGQSPEWSNNFGYEAALEETSDAVTILKKSIARPTPAPAGEWQSILSDCRDYISYTYRNDDSVSTDNAKKLVSRIDAMLAAASIQTAERDGSK